jgi:hypothetical protein
MQTTSKAFAKSDRSALFTALRRGGPGEEVGAAADLIDPREEERAAQTSFGVMMPRIWCGDPEGGRGRR